LEICLILSNTQTNGYTLELHIGRQLRDRAALQKTAPVPIAAAEYLNGANPFAGLRIRTGSR
jgi:hypothetical protein